MDELHLKIAAGVPPQGQCGIESDISVLVITDLAQEIGDGRRWLEGLRRELLALIEHVVKADRCIGLDPGVTDIEQDDTKATQHCRARKALRPRPRCWNSR
jgi:hypothetical protein